MKKNTFIIEQLMEKNEILSIKRRQQYFENPCIHYYIIQYGKRTLKLQVYNSNI